MHSDEVVPVLDVHPPHEAVHGWRDFLLHLMTITIGLLIALGLEGTVEWEHHRHLVHEAEAGLHREIEANAESMQDTLDRLAKQQAALKHDGVVLKKIINDPKTKDQDSMDITYNIRGFDDVSWKTAQNTGALSYMPYDMAREYSDIYSTQADIDATERQAARDAIISLAPFENMGSDDPISASLAVSVKDKIEVLQGQLDLLSAMEKHLDGTYKTFLKAHP